MTKQSEISGYLETWKEFQILHLEARVGELIGIGRDAISSQLGVEWRISREGKELKYAVNYLLCTVYSQWADLI